MRRTTHNTLEQLRCFHACLFFLPKSTFLFDEMLKHYFKLMNTEKQIVSHA